MEKKAVIVAGGNGSRMNTATPKQFLLLKNKPVLYYTINTFLNAYPDLSIILVLPESHVTTGTEIIDTFFDHARITITTGGHTRFHSVQNGLQLIREESIVFIHDAVRCLVTEELIHRCYESALKKGSAVPAIDCKDSIRILNGNSNESVSRHLVKLIQTPQTFHSKILLPAFAIDHKYEFTDEAMVMEAFGLKVQLVKGEECNIKLTSPVDILLAEHILEQRLKKNTII